LLLIYEVPSELQLGKVSLVSDLQQFIVFLIAERIIQLLSALRTKKSLGRGALIKRNFGHWIMEALVELQKLCIRSKL
jgi:hypothetical protein